MFNEKIQALTHEEYQNVYGGNEFHAAVTTNKYVVGSAVSSLLVILIAFILIPSIF